MKKILILAVALLIIGNLGWGQDVTLKLGKMTDLPYKTDLVGGVSFDFSLAPSVKVLKNLRGEINILMGNPDWVLWQNMVWARSNQFLFDLGLSYQFSFKVKKIKIQPYVGAGFGYLYARLDYQDYSYYYNTGYYDDSLGRYSLENKSSFDLYFDTGLKIFLSKNTFVRPELRVYQAGDRKMTAFLIGIGYQIKPSKKGRP